MVSYASTAKLEFDYVDNINDFKSGFAFAAKQKTYQKGTFGGTNWEDGIQTARKLYDSSHREDAEQYIIFVSDGEPTSRITKGSWYEHFDAYEYKMSNNNTQPNVLTDTTTNKQYYAYGYANLSNGQYYYTGVEHAYTHSKDDAAPNFQILFYPVITMDLGFTHKGSHDNFLGEGHSKKELRKLEAKYSNELQVNRTTSRAFLALSDDDKTVPVANGLHYYEQLYRHDVPASLHIYPTGGHGWGYHESFDYHYNMIFELKAWLQTF